MSIEKLYERRTRAVNEEREILDRCAADSRDPSAEERAVLDRIDVDIRSLTEQIKHDVERARMDAEADAAKAEWERIARPVATETRTSGSAPDPVEAFFRGQGPRAMDFDFTAVAREKRALRVGATGREFRDLTVGTALTAGNLVPTDFARQLYDYLEMYSGVRRLNVTVLTTAGGNNLDIPKVTVHGTAAIVGEGTALAESDAQFNKTTLGSWKYGQLVQVTNELLADSGVDVISFLARDLGRALARVTDTAYAAGTGTNEPLGFSVACGTSVTGANGGTGVPSADDLLTTVYSVNSAYRANGAQWAMRDTTIAWVRKLKDTTNQYLWQPSMQAGEPERLLGYPIVEVPAMPATATSAKSICFGDFAGYYIRDVGSLRVERSDEFAFSTDLVTWRAVLRTDGDLVDLSGAVKAFRGGTA